MKGNSVLSPSFAPSSSGPLHREIIDDPRDHSLNLFDGWDQRQVIPPEEGADDDDDDEEQEFEFSVAFTDAESCTISADEIFHNGRIRPIYPLFDTSLLAEEISSNQEEEEAKQPERVLGLPLGRLLKEERGEAWSSSDQRGDVVDELQGLAPDTYCVWTPNREAAAASPGFRKKSNSTGSCSSNRWKLRNILSRSSSEGRENSSLVSWWWREKPS